MVKKAAKTQEKTPSVLVIGDPHYNQNRKKAIQAAEASIWQVVGLKTFDICIITGDLFDETPTIEERVMLATFLKRLSNYAKRIVLIKGTDTHEFTKGFYNLEDVILLSNIEAQEEFEFGKYLFGHYEVKGTKYINGFESKSEKVVEPDRTYMLGHIHSPTCSFKNVNYVGSMYKTDFAEAGDVKRIAMIEDGKVTWLNIESRPMKQVKLIGINGEVKVSKESKEIIMNTPEKTELDLKISVETDSQTLGVIHRHIAKIKEKFVIEYYRQEIAIKEIKADVPKDLDKAVLFKTFCEKKNIPYALAEKELNKK